MIELIDLIGRIDECVCVCVSPQLSQNLNDIMTKLEEQRELK